MVKADIKGWGGLDMSYKLSELSQAKEDFRAVFNTGLGALLDNEVTTMFAALTINIVAFNAWMEKEHGDFAALSLNQMVEKHYGTAGTLLIDKLLEL